VFGLTEGDPETIELPDGAVGEEVIMPDGVEAGQIVAPDGTVVFQQIPDSAIAHYDAQELTLSDQDVVDTWPDSESNNDLTGGDPIFVEDGINGLPSVEFDGEGDVLTTAFSANITQPYTVFAVFQSSNTPDAQQLYDGDSVRAAFQNQPDQDRWDLWAGEYGNVFVDFADVSATDGRLQTGVFDGINSKLRVNEIEDTGNVGTNELDGFRIGARPDGDRPWNGYVGEVLVLNEAADSETIANQEERLKDKWDLSF